MDAIPGYTICGQGPAAVLLHSSMSSKEQWKPLIPQISKRFKVIAIDLAGYGDNSLPLNPQTFSTRDEVNIVKSILTKKLGHNEPFHLIGHSYGGAVALKLCVKTPDQITTLTLFEPVVFHLLPRGKTAHKEITAIVNQMAHALEENNRVYATQVFIDYWSGKGTFENLNARNQNLFIRYIEKVMLDFQALFNESLTLKDYSKITMPICMIKGEKSPLSSLQIFAILEQCFKGPSIYCVPGGHMSPITHFKQVNAIIEKFLTAESY